MTKHTIKVEETPEAVDAAGTPITERRLSYIVTAESGLFKNGKQYDQGETIELAESAGKNFIKSGDVKEIK